LPVTIPVAEIPNPSWELHPTTVFPFTIPVAEIPNPRQRETRNASTIEPSAEESSTPSVKFEIDPFRTALQVARGRLRRYRRRGAEYKVGPRPSDRETGEVDRDTVGGNQQAGAVRTREGEVVDELIRARFIDRPAFLDLDRSFLPPVLCLRGNLRREDYRREGEHYWKKRFLFYLPRFWPLMRDYLDGLFGLRFWIDGSAFYGHSKGLR
jgi:hypothetical protein